MSTAGNSSYRACAGRAMDKLNVDLANCYGIKKLKTKFDFTPNKKVYVIYAPNGVMKSSLAQTFKDIADGTESKDRVFPSRTCVRKITDENGGLLPKESVLVLPPYDQEFGHTEKTSTLLVNATLRKEYDQLNVGIETSKQLLMNALKEQSHSRKDIEKEISSAFTSSDDEFKLALTRIKEELLKQTDAPLADVLYDTIFDDKVLGALGTKDVKTAIEGYVQRYSELLAASTYFKKGTFDYYNAGQIAKSLASNGFFDAKHSVNLNAANKKQLEITTEKELENVIAKEKDAIIKDKSLRKKFDEIQTLIQKNVTLRDFQNYLLDHEALLPQLANIKKFKEDIWKSYLKARFDVYLDLINKYDAAEARKKQIEEEAAKQRTQWEDAIDIFNDRFFVPFTLIAKNRIPVMLGAEPMLDLGYIYEDGTEKTQLERAALVEVLSTGEKKALYILNIIFEIRTRQTANQETIFIVDDIADSFDYKNKYAIIQYLKEISDDVHFRQIILTHNFDFFRTINRAFVPYSHCLMAFKRNDGLILEKAEGIRNIFVNDWKPEFFDNPRKRIASIPFLRNLIEYTKGETVPDYIKLTSLLHWKPDSASITQGDLDAIYGTLMSETRSSADIARPVIESIREEGKKCLASNGGVNFENKIVLSIAIRIDAERFMLAKIGDSGFKAGDIEKNQTQALLREFERRFASETGVIKTLRNVALMTPETIHLNSFMYEPILAGCGKRIAFLLGDR